MRRIDLWTMMTLLLVQLASATAGAQDAGSGPDVIPPGRVATEPVEVPPEHVTVQDIANRPLKGPRAEVIGGSLLTASAPLIGMSIAFFAGPGLFYCGILGEPDPACEAERERCRSV
jgi:hypothetical protein